MSAPTLAPASRWTAAWNAALDALELEVGRVEALLVDDHAQRDVAWAAAATAHTEWTAPTGLPPLPAELTARARSVLDRQSAAAAALAVAMTANRRQSMLAARMSPPQVSRPAFLDRAV